MGDRRWSSCCTLLSDGERNGNKRAPGRGLLLAAFVRNMRLRPFNRTYASHYVLLRLPALWAGTGRNTPWPWWRPPSYRVQNTLLGRLKLYQGFLSRARKARPEYGAAGNRKQPALFSAASNSHVAVVTSKTKRLVRKQFGVFFLFFFRLTKPYFFVSSTYNAEEARSQVHQQHPTGRHRWWAQGARTVGAQTVGA